MKERLRSIADLARLKQNQIALLKTHDPPIPTAGQLYIQIMEAIVDRANDGSMCYDVIVFTGPIDEARAWLEIVKAVAVKLREEDKELEIKVSFFEDDAYDYDYNSIPPTSAHVSLLVGWGPHL